MAGIKNVRNGFLFIFLHAFVITSLACKEKFPESRISLLDSEVNYDYELMIDAQKDSPSNETSYEYSLKIIKAEKDFLKRCLTITDNEELIGNWNLVDNDGKEIRNHSFLFNEHIIITKYKNEIVLDNWGSRSLLYSGNDNRYYIYSRGIGIIRLIKIRDDKLFVYIVKNKEWVLDPIHDGGKYSFQKKCTDTNVFTEDMKKWFEQL